jgi:hypothetical protein
MCPIHRERATGRLDREAVLIARKKPGHGAGCGSWLKMPQVLLRTGCGLVDAPCPANRPAGSPSGSWAPRKQAGVFCSRSSLSSRAASASTRTQPAPPHGIPIREVAKTKFSWPVGTVGVHGGWAGQRRELVGGSNREDSARHPATGAIPSQDLCWVSISRPPRPGVLVLCKGAAFIFGRRRP